VPVNLRPAAKPRSIHGEVSPVLFDGQTIKVDTHDGGLAELRFERGSEAVNKLDAPAFGELRRAIDAITAAPAIRG
jgi:3-hydroxyacyl-CoA dehydrogenase/enoyl-CoA hydratase/3-hydroxybutyryl-CoA epimerase/enoyl-CoA isomerase